MIRKVNSTIITMKSLLLSSKLEYFQLILFNDCYFISYTIYFIIQLVSLSSRKDLEIGKPGTDF